MRKLFGKLSINMKIFCITALILLSSMLITGSYVHSQSRKLYSESLDKAIQLIMQKNSSAIMEYFRRAEALANTLYTEIPTFAPEIEQETDVFQNYRTYLGLKTKMDSVCKAIWGEDSVCSSYLLLHSDYPVSDLFRAPESSLLYDNPIAADYQFFIYSDEALQDEEWFQHANSLEDGSAYWFASPVGNNMILSANSLSDIFMINGEAREYSLGTLVISIDISKILEYYDNDAFANDMGIFITDSDNQIMFAKDDSLLGSNFYSLVEEKGSFPTVTMDGISFRLWEQILPNDMSLFILMPEQTFNSQIWVNLKMLFVFFLLVLFAEIILAALFTRMITKPISQLSNHMKVSTVPTLITHDYKTNDEIGVLYCTYNEMVEKHEVLIQQIYDYSEYQKRLKYKMLQAQINPHFLYNTLDSVSCAALINGENELSDVLSKLASLLRYNINQSDQLVTLHDELEMVKDYIAIQQFRCDNHIRITYDISQEITNIRLPKTILQPLVENSIFYGSTNEDGYSYIHIQMTLESGPAPGNKTIVSIQVCNEHKNMENSVEADVELLNNYLKGNCELKRRSSALGVLNVQQRIQLAFGEKYGIHYEQMGENIAAVINLPFFT